MAKRGRPKKAKSKTKTPKKKPPAESQAPPGRPEVVPYPAAGQKVTDFEAELNRQIAGDQSEPVSRGPGRPAKEKVPEPAADQGAPIELVEDFVKVPFELWALSQGVSLLSLKPAETKRLAEPVKKLLDYYMPRVPAIAYVWFNLTVTAYFVSKPRLEMLSKLRKEKEHSRPAEPAAAGPAAQPGTGNAAGSANFPKTTEIKPTKT